MPWTTILAMLSTGFALVALAVSLWRVQLPRRTLGQITNQLGDIEHDIESLRSTVRRVNARVGMRDAREKRNGAPTEEDQSSDDPFAQRPNESAAEWKARMRAGPLRRGLRP